MDELAREYHNTHDPENSQLEEDKARSFEDG